MIFFKRVLIKLHTSYVEQAMTMYREVLKQKPDDADTHCNHENLLTNTVRNC